MDDEEYKFDEMNNVKYKGRSSLLDEVDDDFDEEEGEITIFSNFFGDQKINEYFSELEAVFSVIEESCDEEQNEELIQVFKRFIFLMKRMRINLNTGFKLIDSIINFRDVFARLGAAFSNQSIPIKIRRSILMTFNTILYHNNELLTDFICKLELRNACMFYIENNEGFLLAECFQFIYFLYRNNPTKFDEIFDSFEFKISPSFIYSILVESPSYAANVKNYIITEQIAKLMLIFCSHGSKFYDEMPAVILILRYCIECETIFCKSFALQCFKILLENGTISADDFNANFKCSFDDFFSNSDLFACIRYVCFLLDTLCEKSWDFRSFPYEWILYFIQRSENCIEKQCSLYTLVNCLDHVSLEMKREFIRSKYTAILFPLIAYKTPDDEIISCEFSQIQNIGKAIITLFHGLETSGNDLKLFFPNSLIALLRLIKTDDAFLVKESLKLMIELIRVMSVQGEMHDFIDIFNLCDGESTMEELDNTFADEKEILELSSCLYDLVNED